MIAPRYMPVPIAKYFQHSTAITFLSKIAIDWWQWCFIKPLVVTLVSEHDWYEILTLYVTAPSSVSQHLLILFQFLKWIWKWIQSIIEHIDLKVTFRLKVKPINNILCLTARIYLIVLQSLRVFKFMDQRHWNPDAFQELTQQTCIIPALWLWAALPTEN